MISTGVFPENFLSMEKHTIINIVILIFLKPNIFLASKL